MVYNPRATGSFWGARPHRKKSELNFILKKFVGGKKKKKKNFSFLAKRKRPGEETEEKATTSRDK